MGRSDTRPPSHGSPALALGGTIGSLLIVLVVTGCASLRAGGERWHLITGQMCYAVQPDSHRTDFAALADTTALRQSMSDIPELSLPAGDTILVSVGYDGLGVRTHISAAHPAISIETLRRIENVLRSHLPEHGPVNGHSDAVVIRKEYVQVKPYAPTVACEPTLVNRDVVEKSLERLIPLVHGRRHALVFIKVDGRGLPEEVKIHRSSGAAHVDEDLLKVASRARFAPALYDEHLPVPVWVQIPLRVHGVGSPPVKD
jgi:TonB family protein